MPQGGQDSGAGAPQQGSQGVGGCGGLLAGVQWIGQGPGLAVAAPDHRVLGEVRRNEHQTVPVQVDVEQGAWGGDVPGW